MAWTIEGATTEEAWTLDFLATIMERQPLPPKERKLGAVTVRWEEIDPGVAWIKATGGSPDDRRIAELMVASRLKQSGVERAQFTFDKEHRTADWDDIEAKAKRLINSGNVTLLRNGFNNIVAHVIGDHGEYTCEIGRDDPDSRAITTWQCECPWDQFAWGRTRQWKKYEGRPCAHVLASFWQSQSTPLDADAIGSPPTPGQRGPVPQVPADIPAGGMPAGVGDQMQLPVPGGNPDQPTPMPAAPQMQPGQPNILPPFPGAQLQLIPPGTIPNGQPIPPGSTVSVPGARQPDAFNPMQNPSTLSSVQPWEFSAAATDFNNGDAVKLTEEEWGTLEGKSVAHGAGGFKRIPRGSVGEVLGQDPTTGWVDTIFLGPQKDAGPMEPYHVRAYLEPSKLTLLK